MSTNTRKLLPAFRASLQILKLHKNFLNAFQTHTHNGIGLRHTKIVILFLKFMDQDKPTPPPFYNISVLPS